MKTVIQTKRLVSLPFSNGHNLNSPTQSLKWLGVLCFAGLLSAGTAQVASAAPDLEETTIVDWKFTAAEGWEPNSVQSLIDAGWSVNTAANSDTAFFVDTASEVLELWDNVTTGAPGASYTFGSVNLGKIDLTAAINQSGTANISGGIFLRSGNTNLVRIRLQNPDLLEISYAGSSDGGGTGYKTVVGVTPGASTLKDYSLSWAVGADGTNSKFTFAVDGDVLFEDEGFMANLVPDTLYLEVGFASATNRQLYLGDLSIVSFVPESSTLALIFGTLAFGLVVLRRRLRG